LVIGFKTFSFEKEYHFKINGVTVLCCFHGLFPFLKMKFLGGTGSCSLFFTKNKPKKEKKGFFKVQTKKMTQ
jgi:hypothetical protein